MLEQRRPYLSKAKKPQDPHYRKKGKQINLRILITGRKGTRFLRFVLNKIQKRIKRKDHMRDQISHFLSSIPSGGVLSIVLAPTSFQLVDSTVPFDSTCSNNKEQKLLQSPVTKKDQREDVDRQILTKDLLMARLISSSAME